MRNVVKGVLHRPVTAAVSIIALAVFFVVSMTSITMKLMPDMSVPLMLVQVVYPGASPEDADELVADKINNACESLAGVKAIQTECTEGLALVLVQYEYGKDMDKAYNDLRESVEGIRNTMPSEIMDPVILEMDTNAVDDITLSVTGNTDDVDVLTEVNEKVVPELKKCSLLAQTNVSGGDKKYVRVQVLPEYLTQYGLDLTTIADAIAGSNFSMPTGTAHYGDQSLPLSAEVKYATIPELEQIPINVNGQTIHLNDVADVGYAVSEKDSLSRYMGMENVSIGIKRKQSASSVTLSRQVMPVLEQIRKDNPNLNIVVVSDMADTILTTLKGVGKTMVEAILLAMFIIFVFFGDIKGSLIVGSMMPVSIMATIVCMQLAGFALDIITMAALIIAIGMMTDNAVVVIEMCFRKHQSGMTFREAALEGTSVVINSVVGSTITTVVVYLPLATMKGLSGQLFKPLGATIIFALLSSLISAITLIPLCFSLYKPVEKRDIITNRFLRRLTRRYRKALRFALKWKKSVLLVALAILVVTGFLATKLQTELMSGTDEGIVEVSVKFRPNLELYAMDDTVRAVEDYIKENEDIENFSTSISKTDSAAHISAYLKKDTKTTTQEVVDEWNDDLRTFRANCEIRVSAGSTMGMGSVSNTTTQEFDITSVDLDKLKATSKEIIKIMEETEGVLYTSSNYTDNGAQAKVVIDPVMATARGFSARQLAGMVYNNMAGKKACDVNIDNKNYEVTVKYPDKYFDSVSDVENMTFTNMQGVTVPLTEVGSVAFTSAPQTVQRQNGLYVDMVVATMSSTARDEVAKELQEKVENMEMDPDVGFLDEAMMKMLNEEFTALGLAIFIAIFLVFVVLAVQFESLAVALLIMLCVPFAGIGSILYLLLMNIKLSMVSLMGVLMLSGIVVNNGIILIDMAIQNQKKGMNTAEALVDAGAGRLRPILMTTLTTVMAMIPVSLGMSKDAMAMQGMAGVIVGGLFASTLLTLILLPTFYLLLDKSRQKHAARAEKRQARLEEKVASQESLLHERERERARVNLVFPMGGAGTRFLGDDFDLPKPLIDLDGEPFFKHAADSLIGKLKYERLVFVVLKEHVEKYEIDKKIQEYYPDAEIVQLKQVLPGAVMTAMEGAKKVRNGLPVIFTDCDLMFKAEDMYEFYRAGGLGADGTLLTFESDLDRYSYVKVGEDDFAEATAEKKVISNRAIMGAYGFANASMFLDMAADYIRNCPYDEYYMSGVYNVLMDRGRKVKVFEADEYMSFGTPDEYRAAEEKLKEAKKAVAETNEKKEEVKARPEDTAENTEAGEESNDAKE